MRQPQNCVLLLPPPEERRVDDPPADFAQNAFASVAPAGRSVAAQLTKQTKVSLLETTKAPLPNSGRLFVDKKSLLLTSSRRSRPTKRLSRDNGRHFVTTMPTDATSMTLPSTKRTLLQDTRRTSSLSRRRRLRMATVPVRISAHTMAECSSTSDRPMASHVQPLG